MTRRQSPSRIEAELVGGPHDGLRFAVAELHEELMSSEVPDSAVEPVKPGRPVDSGRLRYRLDHGCLDGAGALAAAFARYLYQPRLLTPT